MGQPTKSTVKIDVGQFKSGERRYEIRHLNDVHCAHPKSLAAPAQRPKLGRPPQMTVPSGIRTSTEDRLAPRPPPTDRLNRLSELPPQEVSSEPASIGDVNKPVDGSKQTLPNEIQTAAGNRPVRSTRNPSPIYVDAFSTVAEATGPPPFRGFPKLRTWSASASDLDAINASIGTRRI